MLTKYEFPLFLKKGVGVNVRSGDKYCKHPY